MSELLCTEPVCGHHWTAAADAEIPRCPRCGGFWVRVVSVARPEGRRRGRLLVRSAALAGR